MPMASGSGTTTGDLALVLRTSEDNGATWTAPRLIGPEHQPRHQVIDTFLRPRDGVLVLESLASIMDIDSLRAILA